MSLKDILFCNKNYTTPKKYSFNDDLQKEYAFLTSTKLDSGVNCTLCNTFSVCHGGRSDIKDHKKTCPHIKLLQMTKHTGFCTYI